MPVELLVTKEVYENHDQSFTSLCIVEALLSCSEDFIVRTLVPDLGAADSQGLLQGVCNYCRPACSQLNNSCMYMSWMFL
jgi:hypothetical protein